MATNQARKFAAQSILVDNVLDAHTVAGNAGRVVFILDAANKTGGETQKQILEATNLPKDVVSKLVKSLLGRLADACNGKLADQTSTYHRKRKKVIVPSDGCSATISSEGDGASKEN
jgi:hypothetical protein